MTRINARTPNSKIPRLIKRWKKDERTIVIGNISSGKTVFLTEFGFANIELGARFMHSVKRLNITRPQNRVKANSTLLSDTDIPHFALKIVEKTNVKMTNSKKGLISDQSNPKKDPL